MRTCAVTLRPRGSLGSVITSQTIFGAVCWALHILRIVDVDRLLADFSRSPRFAFSSAFPCVWGDRSRQVVRFFPRPLLPPPGAAQIRRLAELRSRNRVGRLFNEHVKKLVADAKEITEAAYVSQGLFSDICAGRRDVLGLVDQWGVTVLRTANALWLKSERSAVWGSAFGADDAAWKLADVQRNAVDRVAGATAEGLLFQESQTFFDPARAGLWFAARADDEAAGWLAAAFRYLADTGLGGRRTLGKGHFDLSMEEAPDLLPDVPDADSFISLSQYSPCFCDGQMEAMPQSYALLAVRQKAENKFPDGEQMRSYTAALRLFAEGSIFAAPVRQPVYGCLAPAAQVAGRRVYYNGLCLPAFARLGGAV